MKPTGTNTDSSTSVIAMIGAVIWRIAFFVASAGDRSGSSSITRSTFSTTTIASSTTMPIASTIASSDTVLAEKPSASSTAKVADQADRHRDGGDDGGAQVAQEQEHHDHHQDEGLGQRLDAPRGSCRLTKLRAVVDDPRLQAFGEARRHAVEHRLHRAPTVCTALAPGAR